MQAMRMTDGTCVVLTQRLTYRQRISICSAESARLFNVTLWRQGECRAAGVP